MALDLFVSSLENTISLFELLSLYFTFSYYSMCSLDFDLVCLLFWGICFFFFLPFDLPDKGLGAVGFFPYWERAELVILFLAMD